MSEKQTLTKNDVKSYRDNPGDCPFCGGDLDSRNTNYEEGYITQTTGCVSCNREWTDHYKFDGISAPKDEDGNYIQQDQDLRMEDFEGIVMEILLNRKGALPLLIGITPEFDNMISKHLKGD
jgi:hypothetical protein